VKFLAREEILRVHSMLIEHYGGAHGLRDEGLLLSALAQPEASFDATYLHVDFAEMAAAYGFHLAQNHPFLDGNKRIALAAMLVFLEINGHPLHVGQEELYAVMLGVAEGRVTKGELAGWVRGRAG
jgi:death-on-curing protein